MQIIPKFCTFNTAVRYKATSLGQMTYTRRKTVFNFYISKAVRNCGCEDRTLWEQSRMGRRVQFHMSAGDLGSRYVGHGTRSEECLLLIHQRCRKFL